MKPYRLITDLGEIVFLPIELREEVKDDSRLSFGTAFSRVSICPWPLALVLNQVVDRKKGRTSTDTSPDSRGHLNKVTKMGSYRQSQESNSLVLSVSTILRISLVLASMQCMANWLCSTGHQGHV